MPASGSSEPRIIPWKTLFLLRKGGKRRGGGEKTGE